MPPHEGTQDLPQHLLSPPDHCQQACFRNLMTQMITEACLPGAFYATSLQAAQRESGVSLPLGQAFFMYLFLVGRDCDAHTMLFGRGSSAERVLVCLGEFVLSELLRRESSRRFMWEH